MGKAECKEKAEEMTARFKNLVGEVDVLKLILGTILPMRAGIRHYPSLKSLDDSFEVSETLVKQRLPEIEASLKVLNLEGKKLTTFLKESSKGEIQ